MEERFDRTQVEAKAAIDRARTRQRVARSRRYELELRIAELDGPNPPQRLQAERGRRDQAKDRLSQAQVSSARAEQRAAEAAARRQAG